MRYFNWKLAIVLTVGCIVVVVGTAGLHRWQKTDGAAKALALGLDAHESGDYDEAAVNLGHYISIHKDDVPVLMKYADAQTQRRPQAIGQAIETYRIVLRLDAANVQAAEQLAKYYVGANAAREAELICKRFLDHYPNPEIQRIYAVALAHLGDYDASLLQLKALLEQDPHAVTTYEALGQLAEKHTEKYENTPDQWYDLAIEKNPTSAYARIVRARYYLKQGDNTSAIQELQAAQGMDLTDLDVRLNLAGEMVRAGLLENAEHQLGICKGADAADLRLWQIWSDYALKSQSKEKMQEVAQYGLESLRHDVQDYWPIAIELFITAEQFEKAAECIAQMRASGMSPRIAALAAFWDGRIANHKGDVHAAVRLWRRAIELGYASPRVRMPLASQLVQLGDMQSAHDQLLAVTMEFPDLPNGHVALIRHYQRMDEPRNAQRQARTALQAFPDNVLIQLLDLETRINTLVGQSSESARQARSDVTEQLQRLEATDQYAAYSRQLQFDLSLACEEYGLAETTLKGFESKNPEEDLGIKLNYAKLYLGQQRKEEAVALLEATITEYPDKPEPVRILVAMFVDGGEFPKAIQVLERIWDNREDAAKKELGLWLSELYQREGRDKEAVSLLTLLKQALPGDMQIQRHMITLRLNQHRCSDAQALVTELHDIEGAEGKQWRYEQARVWLADNDTGQHYSELVDLLQRSLKVYPKDKALRLLLASAYEQAGDLQLTISSYRTAYNQSPDDLAVIVPMVNMLQKAGESAEADRVLRRASEQKLTHPALARLKLAGDLRQKRYGPVTDAVENAFGKNPENIKTGLFLARLKVEQRRFDEAELLLKQLEKLDPNSIDLGVVYMDLFKGQGRFADILARSDRLVASRESARSYWMRAEARAFSGEIEGAIQDYEQAVHLDPNLVDVYVSRCKFYQKCGRYENALVDITRAQALSPEDVYIRSLAIELLLNSPEQSSRQEAGQRLEIALKEEPDDPRLLFLKAQGLAQEGTRPSIETAEEILSKIVTAHPAEERAWHLWTRLMLNRGQSGRALDTILSGLASLPHSKALLLLKAATERERSPVLAIQTLKGLLEIYPKDAEIVLGLASLYTESKENQRALDLLERQLGACRPREKLDYNITLALILHSDGQPEKAQALLHKLDQAQENAARVFQARTQIWIRDGMWAELKAGVKAWKSGHPGENSDVVALANMLAHHSNREAVAIAEEILLEAVTHSPKWVEPRLLLGQLFYRTNRIDRAGLQYRDVLHITPDNLIAINNWAWFLCEERQDYVEALSFADRGLKIAPNYVDLLDTRGTIFYRMKQFDKADEDLRRSIQLCPLNATTAVGSRFRLARVYAKMGRRGQAVQYLEESLKMYSQMYQSRGKSGLSDMERVEAKQLLGELKNET
jgi:tetratricopeptide (TPR) repeat protein